MGFFFWGLREVGGEGRGRDERSMSRCSWMDGWIWLFSDLGRGRGLGGVEGGSER